MKLILARNIGMSRVHMYRKIKELTNQSAYDFIKTIRMQQASEILSKQKVNISKWLMLWDIPIFRIFPIHLRIIMACRPRNIRETVL